MPLIPIHDPADPRLGDYLDIRERDLVGREGKFIAEGRVVLNVLFSSSRFEAQSLLVLDKKLPGISDLLATLPDTLPVYVVDQTILDAVAGFNVHRGLLAIGARREAENARLEQFQQKWAPILCPELRNNNKIEPLSDSMKSKTALDRRASFQTHIGRSKVLIEHRNNPKTEYTFRSDALALQTLPANALVLCLVGISNHDNMGAIFRNAAAFGADAVLLDPTCCDPLYRKSIRVSVGAALKVPFFQMKNEQEMFEALCEQGFTQIALSPSGTTTLKQLQRNGRTALYLGTEGTGLPASLMDRMTTVRIAMRSDFDSLNVATSSAIALHHLFE